MKGSRAHRIEVQLGWEVQNESNSTNNIACRIYLINWFEINEFLPLSLLVCELQIYQDSESVNRGRKITRPENSG